MNRYIFLAAASLACPSIAGLILPPEKTDETLKDPEPRYPESPFDPPSQSIPRPLPGRPAPLRFPNEGTARRAASKSDADIIRGLTTALLDDPATPAVKGLTISVMDGKATLRGAVRSQKEKDSVTARAAAVVGAQNVANNITVAP